MTRQTPQGGGPTLLKVLLQERHLQEHRAFNREYDRVAAVVDRALVGGGPTKATFYRWLAGDVVTLPHPAHCRVLEKMLPGRTAHELFEPWSSRASGADRTAAGDNSQPPDLAGLTAVFTTRSDFAHAQPPRRLFDDAMSLDAMGLSLNLLCQQYPDAKVRDLFMRARVRLLFLDPDGEAIKRRTAEEKHEPGHLEHWTRANINVVRRIRNGLDSAVADRVEFRTYDETIRYNVMLIDETVGVMQPYLPQARGVDSPTFVMKRNGTGVDLFGVAAGIFEQTWERGRPVD